MMIHTLLNVFYVLIAISMIVLILLQRGAGAQAGSGFGAGASGTVFGARGSANFLSSSTKWLAALFMGLSLFMAYQANQAGRRGPAQAEVDLGVMSDLPAAAPAAGELAPAPLSPAPLAPAPGTAPAGAAPADAGTAPVIQPPTTSAPAQAPAADAPPADAETRSPPVEGSEGG